MQQIYTISQATGPNTTLNTTITVTFDPAHPGVGTTQMSSYNSSISNKGVVTNSSTTTVNIAGVPTSKDPDTGAVSANATMLYDNGNITSLAGPGEGQAAIQDGTALTVTAAQNVTITGDIRYKTEPVTLTQNQIPGTPADTLIPGADKGQSLGIFTAGGDIQLKNQQSSTNLQIDASLASISATGTGGLINVGNAINRLTIVGGRIQNTIKNINATTRNVFFDRRYTNSSSAPPWFPSTVITHTGMDSPQSVQAQFFRKQWINQTSYQ
jgi:hypothetical protein